MGGMAFPSASEPNPVAQGIRGKGPETINYQPNPSTPPSGPPVNPGTPPSSTPSAWGGPMFFQDPGNQGYVDILSGGNIYSAPWANIATQAQAAGYGSNVSGLPVFNQSLVSGPVAPNYSGGPFGGMQFGISPTAAYDPNNPTLAQYNPQFQPYSPFNPNISNALGQPFSANNVNQFGYTNYQKSGYQPGVY